MNISEMGRRFALIMPVASSPVPMPSPPRKPSTPKRYVWQGRHER